MSNPHGTTAHEIHPVATAEKEDTHSPSDDKPDRSDRGSETSALDQLLKTDEEFYRTMSIKLADILVRMKIPPFLVEDLVQEAWLSAIQNRDLFVEGDAKRLLRGFLRKVVHDKAVDVRRHLDSCACQSFDGQEMELSDEAAAQRAEMAEEHEWLEALLEEVGRDNQENKDLVHAHFFQGITVSELAQRLDMSVDAVDCRIRRLVGKMREQAEKMIQQQV